MKKLTTYAATFAIASAFAFSAPSFATHASVESNYGTPLQNGFPVARQATFDRVIVVDQGVDHINVKSGQRVKFLVGNTSFEWLFNTYDASPAFDLAEIAPAGLLDGKQIKVYVSADPRYYIG